MNNRKGSSPFCTSVGSCSLVKSQCGHEIYILLNLLLSHEGLEFKETKKCPQRNWYCTDDFPYSQLKTQALI